MYYQCDMNVIQDAILNLSGILIFALFISISLVVLDPLRCAKNPDGSRSMVSNPGGRWDDFSVGQWTGFVGNKINRKPSVFTDFPMKYGAFRFQFSPEPIHWVGDFCWPSAQDIRGIRAFCALTQVGLGRWGLGCGCCGDSIHIILYFFSESRLL